MKHNFIFCETDEGFEYGDFPNSNFYQTQEHGFSIDINKDNYVNIDSLETYGACDEMNIKCKTLQELRQYIEQHLNEIKDNKYSKLECFNELLCFINDSILKDEDK